LESSNEAGTSLESVTRWLTMTTQLIPCQQQFLVVSTYQCHFKILVLIFFSVKDGLPRDWLKTSIYATYICHANKADVLLICLSSN